MSVPDVGVAVSKLRQQSAKLNEITDQANQLVKSVETFLNEHCSVGIQAHVIVVDDGEGDGTSLEYRRLSGSYRIAYVEFHNGEDYSVKAWTECTRSQKLESIPKLPELLEAIAKKVDAVLAEAETSIKKVKAVLAPLSPTSPPRPPRPTPLTTNKPGVPPLDTEIHFGN